MDREELIEIMKEAAAAMVWAREGCMTSFDTEDEEKFNEILNEHGVD